MSTFMSNLMPKHVEGQYWCDLIYSCFVSKGVLTYVKSISPNVNGITSLEFELSTMLPEFDLDLGSNIELIRFIAESCVAWNFKNRGSLGIWGGVKIALNYNFLSFNLYLPILFLRTVLFKIGHFTSNQGWNACF